jgi:6-phosphogluconate dehydrogenase
MQVAIVGLGRMSGNMARRLMRGGHEVVAYTTDAAAVTQSAAEGAIGAATLDELVGALRAPRAERYASPPPRIGRAGPP